MNIVDLISGSYPTLSRSQRTIADYILKQPEDACFASLKEFTEAVGTTEVTVVNFTRKIGLNSFLTLKKELQGYIRMRLSPNDKMYRAVGGMDERSDIYRNFVESETATISQTFSNLSDDDLNLSVAMLKDASHIYVVGYDSSLPVVEFLLMRLHYLGVSATQLDFADPSNMLLEIDRADKRALFVLISFPKHAPQMVNLASQLRKRGQQTLVISDQKSDPVVQNAVVTLPCDTSDLLFYNSITSAISMINLICSLLAVETKSTLRGTRGRITTLHSAIFEDASAKLTENTQP